MADALPARTLLDYFRYSAESGKDDLLSSKVGDSWVPISASAFGERTKALSYALASLGLAKGDRVAILSENRPEWPMADFATLSLGAITVPAYTTYLAPQVEYLLKDSQAKVMFVSGETELAKVLEVRDRCGDLQHIVTFRPESPRQDVHSLDSLIELGRKAMAEDPSAYERRAAEVTPGDVATFVYTSGTTGEPKGAILTHGNFVSNVEITAKLFPADPSKVALSFLPISHVFERMADYLYFSKAVSIAYLDSIDRLAQTFGEVKPHFFAAVPRVYEKMLARINAALETAPALRRKIFEWAIAVGRKRIALEEAGQPVPSGLALKSRVADALVYKKIRARLGGRFEFAISGGAPLSREVADFFFAAGVRVYEGYGLTETSPVLTCNRPASWRLGTVGKPIDGVTVRLGEDGEVQAKGPNIMKGYWRKQGETEKVFDAEGWFLTGDIGAFDADGFLKITDRKKEILVNAYGKNIAPAPIEAALKGIRFVSSAVLIGDRRKFISALLVPNYERLHRWAGENNVDYRNNDDLIRNAKVRTLYQHAIDYVNSDEPSERRIVTFALLAEDFSIEGGELTPTLKVKRRVIATKYAELIDAMYAAAEAKDDLLGHRNE